MVYKTAEETRDKSYLQSEKVSRPCGRSYLEVFAIYESMFLVIPKSLVVEFERYAQVALLPRANTLHHSSPGRENILQGLKLVQKN